METTDLNDGHWPALVQMALVYQNLNEDVKD
jgi:hypothetical protein